MSLFDLTGEVAVVTGGNGGIGLGIARRFVAAGASVAVVADVARADQAERAVAVTTGMVSRTTRATGHVQAAISGWLGSVFGPQGFGRRFTRSRRSQATTAAAAIARDGGRS